MVETTPDTIPVTPGPLSDAIERLKTTHRAIALTIDGEPAAILQDPAEYQRLLDLAEAADAREGIRRGLADAEAGRTRPAQDVFAELDREYGLQG